MIITGIEISKLAVPLKKPFKTALRIANEIVTNIVVIRTDEGVSGYGEAPPTPVITGDTNGSIRGAIEERYAPLLTGRSVDGLGELLDVVEKGMVKNTSAKAALDIALHDLWGKRWNLPVYRMYGGSAGRLRTDITISLNEPDEMVRDSLEAVGEGYDALKVKVGNDFRLDMLRLKEIRAAIGSGVLVRVDANQGWTPKEAIRTIRFMEDAGLDVELVEQPVAAHDLAGLKHVTDSVCTPILADESLFSARDAIALLHTRAADLLNIKLMKCGGIRNAAAIASMARAAGVACMIGVMMESKVSVTAACHLAAAFASTITMADLDPPILCSDDPVVGGATYDRADITLGDAPGLGIEGIRGL